MNDLALEFFDYARRRAERIERIAPIETRLAVARKAVAQLPEITPEAIEAVARDCRVNVLKVIGMLI